MHKNMKTEIGNERREKEIGRRERMKGEGRRERGKNIPNLYYPNWPSTQCCAMEPNSEIHGSCGADSVQQTLNSEDTHRWKANKCKDLVEAGRSNGFNTNTVTLEVGSQGFLNLEGCKCLFWELKQDKQTPQCKQKIFLWLHWIWTLRNSNVFAISYLLHCYILVLYSLVPCNSSACKKRDVY